MSPVEVALDHYVKMQDEMEMEKHTTDAADETSQYDVNLMQQQQPGVGSYIDRPNVGHHTSSMDALGFAVDYKFKVQKIVARPGLGGGAK